MWNPLAEVVRPTVMDFISAAPTTAAARVVMPATNNAAGTAHLFLNCFISLLPCIFFIASG